MAQYRTVGTTLREYTATEVTALLAKFGPAATYAPNGIKPGTLIRNSTTGKTQVFNGATFVDGVEAANPVAPVNTVAPTITGTLTAGSTLTAVDGTWTGTPTPVLTRVWKKDGVAAGTGATVVAAAGVYTVTVTGTGFGTASATSAGSTVV